MQCLFILMILLFVTSKDLQAQYRITDAGEGEERENGVLGNRQIQIINNTSLYFAIACSVDKEDWDSRRIRTKAGIDVELESRYAYFFVRICSDTDGDTECTTYKLQTKRRYAIKWSIDKRKYVINLVSS